MYAQAAESSLTTTSTSTAVAAAAPTTPDWGVDVAELLGF
jgi:hypothetical protein